LRRADERILFPLPLTRSLQIVRTCFKPDVAERPLARNRDTRNEIVDLRQITETVEQSDGGSLRLCFFANLHDPLTTGAVTHSIFLRVTTLLLFDKRDATQVG